MIKLRKLLLVLCLLVPTVAVTASPAGAHEAHCNRHSEPDGRKVVSMTSTSGWHACTSYFYLRCSNGQTFGTTYSDYPGGSSTNIWFTCPHGTYPYYYYTVAA